VSGSEPPNATLVALVTQILADGRAHPLASVLDAALAALPDRDPDEVEPELEELLLTQRFRLTLDDGVVDLTALLDGRIFTHVMTDDDVGFGSVVIRPDIFAQAWAYDAMIPLATRGNARIGFPAGLGAEEGPPLSLVGPQGWLGDADAGDLMGFRLLNGELHVHPAAPDPDASAAAAGALLAAFEDCDEEDAPGVHLADVIAACTLADDSLFRTAVDPLQALLKEAGLESRHDWVGRAGSDWVTPTEHDRAIARDYHEYEFGFDECCHESYEAAVGAAEIYEGLPERVLRDVSAAVGHGNVAAALARKYLERPADIEQSLERLLLFTRALREVATGEDLAAVHYLEGTLQFVGGELATSERSMRAALNANPRYLPALNEAIWHCELRGDWTRALTHLRGAGMSDDEPVVQTALHNQAHFKPAAVGRNERCPCGSGKKYKACCLNGSPVPLSERTVLVYEKAAQWVSRPLSDDVLIELAAECTADNEYADEFEALQTDPLLIDITLFETGGLKEFVEETAGLVPADERDLATGWHHLPRAMYEVVEVHDTGNITLRNTSDDTTVVIVEEHHTLEPGETVLGRMGEIDGAAHRVGPVLHVPPSLLPSLHDLLVDSPSSEDWVAWLRENHEAWLAGGFEEPWDGS
jgi:SEC-C motif